MKKTKQVRNFYSEFIPFPGDYINLLNEKNLLIKHFYSFITKKFILTKKKGQTFVKSRFINTNFDFEKNYKIIDIGCGTGEKAIKYALAFPNSKVTGIDFSNGSLKYANKLKNFLNIQNITFKKFDLLKDDFSKLGKFDLLQSGGVIHHTDDPKGILKKIKKNLMHKESLLWIYLYSQHGKKHIEENIRKGIFKLIPNDDEFKARMEILKELKIEENYSAEFYEEDSFCSFIQKQYFNFRTLFFYKYSKQKTQVIADSYIHPKSIKYDSKMLKELFENAQLNIVDFWMTPDKFNIKNNKFLKNKLNNKKYDIYDKIEIYSNFIVAGNYSFILKH